MFAYVKDGSIVSMPNGNKGIIIDGNQYSNQLFTTVYSEAERNAVGVYTVEMNETNKKDEEYYINTDITYAFGSGKVTGSYGTATARAIADTKWTQKEIDDGDAPAGADTNTVKDEGLKTIKKRIIDRECAGILAPSDWMYVKAGEEGVSMDSGWKTWRANVRTKCNSMQTQIDNAANVDALATLYAYVNTADEGDPVVMARPLGEFPVKE